MRYLAALLLCSLALSLPIPAATTGLTIEVHARSVAPGEPLRVVVRAPEPMRSVQGRFLGETVSLTRDPGAGPPERWSGWAMIGLDQDPSLTVLDLQGVTLAGRELLGTHAVSIEPKQFPEEQLSVAPRYVEPPPEVQQRLAAERARLNEIYRSRRGDLIARRAFVRPVPGAPTSTFGTRRMFNGKPRSPHSGLDLRAADGTEVLASGPGEVVLAGDLYYSGNTVIVDHGGGLFTLYAHLSAISLSEGQPVRAGQRVGLSGSTGRVTGPHLHWGAKIGDRPFDPTALLDDRLFP